MCLNLSNGSFTVKSFATTNASVGQITITRTASNITVAHAAFAAPLLLNGDFRHALLGSNQFLALLGIDGGVGPFTRRVYIVDFTSGGASPGLQLIHTQPLVAASVALPALAASAGNEHLVFAWSPTATANEAQGLAIFRSDTGAIVLPGPLTVSGVSGAISAEITATQLIMHHPNTFSNDSTSGPRPAGTCGVTDPPAFGQAILGASDPALAVVTRTATIRNDGSDCLTVTAIGDNAPYTVQATSQPLPVELEPGQTLDVTIRYAPTGVGNFNRTLPITRTPATGASVISCSGSARMAVASISVSPSSLNFGTVPVGTAAAPRNFTITNNGELNLTITIPGPAGGAFTWTAIPGPGLALAVGASSGAQTVNFTPSAVGAAGPVSITVTPSGGSSRTVTLNGAGCVSEARISVPGMPPSPYGEIERGFRTVRVVDIANTGTANLTFTARIAGVNAANFGLVLADTDITDARNTRSYDVLPTTTCPPGGGGLNVEPVAVSFHADGPNGVYTAELIIEGHNAVNVPAVQTWTFPLVAEIIDPVPIDVALVLDTSGSMGDMVGSRTKLQAALTGSWLLVEMLRETAPDRCTVVNYGTSPATPFPINLVAGNKAAMQAAFASMTPSGATNIAGGAIHGAEQLAVVHPDSPPALKKAMVVLTDGIENRCYQQGGMGAWYSIGGGQMRSPDLTMRTTSVWSAPANAKVYAIGLGTPAEVNSDVLQDLATGTGASYQGAEDLTGKQFFLLEKYYTQIFMETAGLAQIQDPFYTLALGQKHVHVFDIFPGDVNCMIVIYDHDNARLDERSQGALAVEPRHAAEAVFCFLAEHRGGASGFIARLSTPILFSRSGKISEATAGRSSCRKASGSIPSGRGNSSFHSI